jgi:hypothetical protein
MGFEGRSALRESLVQFDVFLRNLNKKEMRDFTYDQYEALLKALINQGYEFQTFSQFLVHPAKKAIMLRHDVDARRFHSLKFAQIQKKYGVCGTYYFRMVKESFDPIVMEQIQNMGHEVGYHYEDMDFANGDVNKAYELFQIHLAKLREVVEIKTICMHGSPKSIYDNKDVWRHFDYRAHGILGEPYFDLNYNQVFYITDTGRRWDGDRVSVRDKVKTETQFPTFHSTDEIIESLNQGTFPAQVMMNFHPQRWMDAGLQWWIEKFWQATKNQIKYAIIQWRK